jgi:hypothetical protein
VHPGTLQCRDMRRHPDWCPQPPAGHVAQQWPTWGARSCNSRAAPLKNVVDKMTDGCMQLVYRVRTINIEPLCYHPKVCHYNRGEATIVRGIPDLPLLCSSIASCGLPLLLLLRYGLTHKVNVGG